MIKVTFPRASRFKTFLNIKERMTRRKRLLKHIVLVSLEIRALTIFKSSLVFVADAVSSLPPQTINNTKKPLNLKKSTLVLCSVIWTLSAFITLLCCRVNFYDDSKFCITCSTPLTKRICCIAFEN